MKHISSMFGGPLAEDPWTLWGNFYGRIQGGGQGGWVILVPERRCTNHNARSNLQSDGRTSHAVLFSGLKHFKKADLFLSRPSFSNFSLLPQLSLPFPFQSVACGWVLFFFLLLLFLEDRKLYWSTRDLLPTRLPIITRVPLGEDHH